jgi:L-arabinose isomerase
MILRLGRGDAPVDFAKLPGVQLLIIDDETHRRDFADRIRWNRAYYRLARGF